MGAPERREERRAAFLVHARHPTQGDVWRFLAESVGGGERLARALTNPFFNWMAGMVMRHLPPAWGFVELASLSCVGVEVRVLAIALTAHDMRQLAETTSGRRYLIRRLLAPIRYAVRRWGVRVVGLGAYTAPFLRGGKEVEERISLPLAITHGDHLPAAVAVRTVGLLTTQRGWDLSQLHVAVVGASGIVGGGIARLLFEGVLVRPPRTITLVAHRHPERLSPLYEEARRFRYPLSRIRQSCTLHALREAEVVILTTTAPAEILTPEYVHLSRPTLVLDVAQPPNVGRTLAQQVPCVQVVWGGNMRVPVGESVEMGFGFPSGTIPSCLVETLLLAREARPASWTGVVEASRARELLQRAEALGFQPAWEGVVTMRGG